MKVFDKNNKPTPEDFGYIGQQGFDGLPSEWAFKGGEEKYWEEFYKWKEKYGTCEENIEKS
jgi:hypothetical protein